MKDKYDLIVIGTGFASSFFLQRYLQTAPANAKVLVLERGIFFPHKDRLKQAAGTPVPTAARIEQIETTIVNGNTNKDWGFNISMGGGSNCWTGCVPRFMPNDFRMSTQYGVGMDWPISYEELEPYYCEAEEIMAIAGPESTPYPMSKKYPLPSHKLSSVDKILQKQYGSLHISQPSARASIPYKGRGACCSSGICDLCPVDSKFTIENSLIGIYSDSRVTLLHLSNVFSLQAENDHVNAVHFMQDGKEDKAEGELIVLGANAIFNAHILLNTGDKNIYTGKGISEQIGISSFLYLDGLDNLGGSSFISANGFMLFDGPHRSERGAILIESHNYPFIRNEYGKWRQIAKFKYVIEDLPQDQNKVQLSNDHLKPEVIYSGHSDYAKKSLELLPELIKKTFSSLPVERVEMDLDIQRSEFHICSTTRMSDRAENGVIDKNMIHHQYRNLFVLGSGAFPTISASNPTLTLSALSLLAADKAFGKINREF